MRWLKVQLALLVAFLVLLLELDNLTTSGKYATAGNWSAGKPGATTEVRIPEGKTAKIEAEALARAILIEGTFEGTNLVVIGDGTAPTEAAISGYALKLTSTASYTHTGKVWFKGTSATRLLIEPAGKTLPISELRFELAGKYELASNLTMSAATGAILFQSKSKADVKLAGKTVKVTRFQMEEENTLDATNATIICTEAQFSTAGSTITLTGSTLELTGSGASLTGNLTYGTVKFNQRVVTILSSFTAGTVEVLNKGGTAEGLKFTKGITVTITSSISGNGTGGEPNRIESSEAGQTFKLVLPVGGLELAATISVIKDCDASGGGALYVPNATTIEGCTNVLKEAKPAAAGGNVMSMLV